MGRVLYNIEFDIIPCRVLSVLERGKQVATLMKMPLGSTYLVPGGEIPKKCNIPCSIIER
jgi:hypothetical protein